MSIDIRAGDTIQVLLTLGGVPYAKTETYIRDMPGCNRDNIGAHAFAIGFRLAADITNYSNEQPTESDQ